jgi:ABC-2 type transport system ATP-binding protein
VASAEVISASHTERQSTLFVRSTASIPDPAWTGHKVSLEDFVLACLARPAASVLPGPAGEGPRDRMEARA